jgi:glycosyltransferase involved in cell wall biosynthesis
MLENFRFLAPEYDVQVQLYVGEKFSSEITEIPETSSFHRCRRGLMDRMRSWRFGGGSRLVQREGNDVMFTTSAETVSFSGIPYVVMLHDVEFLRCRQYGALYTARLFALHWLAAHSAKLILANSEFSKQDVVRYFHVAPEKVLVTHLGCNHEVFNMEPVHEELKQRIAARFKLERPYILHHGTIQPRKNLARLVEAYSLYIKTHPDAEIDLVLAGSYGWNYQPVLDAVQCVPKQGRVVITGSLDLQELVAFVKGARLSVIPALNEGFCFPMVESMACGIPTIVADNSCLPEISGGVLHYFNAESVEQIADAIRVGLEDEELRARLSLDGRRRALDFNWDRCARETLTALKSVATTSH